MRTGRGDKTKQSGIEMLEVYGSPMLIKPMKKLLKQFSILNCYSLIIDDVI